MMIRSLVSHGLASAERRMQLPGSMDYLRTIARTSRSAFLKFSLFLPLASHRKRVPTDAQAAARLAAVLHQDCGSCVRVVLAQAMQEGVAPALLQSLLDGRTEDVPDVVARAFHFGRAVAENSPQADALRERVRRDFGEEGLVELALAIASAQLFPITKRALGHARSCSATPIRIEEGPARA